jgi:hypothetical protein
MLAAQRQNAAHRRQAKHARCRMLNLPRPLVVTSVKPVAKRINTAPTVHQYSTSTRYHPVSFDPTS